jgi:3-deoxy-7-phosphoheptulonate synthase
MLVAQAQGMPVLGDPSHTAGEAWMVPQLARSYIAAGAEGLIVEVHNNPTEAWSDAKQQLDIPTFQTLHQSVISLYDMLNSGPSVRAVGV